MIALTFDGGPDPTTTQALATLARPVKCQSYILYATENVSANPDIKLRSAKKVIKSELYLGSPSIAKIELDNAKRDIDTQEAVQKRQAFRLITRPPY